VIGDASSLTAWATLSVAGNSFWTWANPDTQSKALQTVSGSSRESSCWDSGSSFTVDLNLSDGQSHQVGLYLLDWDSLAVPKSSTCSTR
jgi:hypothetical protein